MNPKQILIVGTGSIGERHVRCFLRTRRVEVSICEPRDSVRERIARDYEVKHAFATLDEALTNEFHGAVICVPAHHHIPLAIQLAEKGIGLLIEKPLSTSEDGIDTLINLSESRRIPIAVGYVLRCDPAMRAMKQAIDSGRFGRPVEAYLTSGQHFPFYRPAYRAIYYKDRHAGGGAIQDALTHMFNAAEWLVGPITKLVADADHLVLEDVEVEDTVHVVARHGAIMGSFTLNQHQTVNETVITVVGTRGTARLELHKSRWMSCSEPNTSWLAEDTFPAERDGLFLRQAESFLDHLLGLGEPPCSLADARQTLRVNLAALQSVATRSWIDL